MIAASATEVAWLPPYVTRCRLRVLNLATGRPETVGLPAASSVANAAFSPDGSLLAVELSFSNNSADGAQPVQLELVSMATGRLTAVPQTWVSSTALVGFGWAAGRDSLIAELSFTTKVQLASWRPGASRRWRGRGYENSRGSGLGSGGGGWHSDAGGCRLARHG